MTGSPDHDSPTTVHPLVPVAQLPETNQPTIDIAEQRRIPLSEHGTKRAKNSRGCIDDHIRGILGEFAVAKLLGIPDEVDTEIYAGGDGGYDLQFRSQRIDVKTVGPHWSHPRLIVPVDRELRADYYVLVQEISAHAYRVIGYAPAIVVANADVRPIPGDRFGREAYTVEQHDLFPIPQAIATATSLRYP